MSLADVPFPLDTVCLQDTSAGVQGAVPSRLLIASQDGVQLAELMIEASDLSTPKAEITVPKHTETQSGWNFDIVHQPIISKDGSQLSLGSVVLGSELQGEKSNTITKLQQAVVGQKTQLLFTTNKGQVGSLVIHKDKPRIYFRFTVTDSSITCCTFDSTKCRLLCGTGNEQLQTLDLSSLLT